MGLALGMTWKVDTTLEKELKLKARKLWGLFTTSGKRWGKKLICRTFLPPPPPPPSRLNTNRVSMIIISLPLSHYHSHRDFNNCFLILIVSFLNCLISNFPSILKTYRILASLWYWKVIFHDQIACFLFDFAKCFMPLELLYFGISRLCNVK